MSDDRADDGIHMQGAQHMELSSEDTTGQPSASLLQEGGFADALEHGRVQNVELPSEGGDQQDPTQAQELPSLLPETQVDDDLTAGAAESNTGNTPKATQ